ncbi:hypothetical protein C8R44DRAFT_319822 [Mycena epipterygia]|nr:hypothetical protein C8R44DRAFT_319822 [Mycena epipterygia]
MATPQHREPTALHRPATLLLVGVSFLGAFSRFTSGRYTPQWYTFQVARVPNASLLIPAMDAILGSLPIPYSGGYYHRVLRDGRGDAGDCG